MQKKALLRRNTRTHTSDPLPEAIFSFANDMTLPSASFTDQWISDGEIFTPQKHIVMYFKSAKDVIIPILRSVFILWSVEQACTIKKLHM